MVYYLLICKKSRKAFIYFYYPAIVLENKPKLKEENVMKAEKEKNLNKQGRSLPKYEPPTMITYSEEELLDDIETMSVQTVTSPVGTGINC